MPLVTVFITLLLSGLISFKFGPMSAFDPASASVWQVEQIALFKKTSLPISNNSSDFTGRKKKN